jgi:hypothetical protein
VRRKFAGATIIRIDWTIKIPLNGAGLTLAVLGEKSCCHSARLEPRNQRRGARLVVKTCGVEMAEDLRKSVAASAWNTYLLGHHEVDARDGRRCTMERFIHRLFERGERDPEELLTAALVYLRKLDYLGAENFH